MKTLLKLFDATLLDYSECHLHCYDYRHCLNVISSSFWGHSILIPINLGTSRDFLFFVKAARELWYHIQKLSCPKVTPQKPKVVG